MLLLNETPTHIRCGQDPYYFSPIVERNTNTFQSNSPQNPDLAGDNLEEISMVKKLLDNRFKIKDLGPLKFFLGMELASTHCGITLYQRNYTLDLLHDTALLGAKPIQDHLIVLVARHNGCCPSSVIFKPCILVQQFYSVTAPLRPTLPQIQSFMNAPNILNWIVIQCETSAKLEFFIHQKKKNSSRSPC